MMEDSPYRGTVSVLTTDEKVISGGSSDNIRLHEKELLLIGLSRPDIVNSS